MKNKLVLPLIIATLLSDATAATRPAARSGSRTTGTTTNTSSATGTKPVAARAARTTPATGGIAAATTTATAGKTTVNRGRAGTLPSTNKPVVAARAATKQKVVNNGTKIASATKNVTVDEGCQEKYDGCMDSFCMLENNSGGRCVCSDKNAELDAILAEIEKLDAQSYQMATFGVEKIEMGAFANEAIAAANAAAASVVKQEAKEEKKKVRKAIDLSMWDSTVGIESEDEDEIFGETAVSPIEGKEGDELHRTAAKICANQIPECKSDLSMLQMMYAQRIKSDCSAYENSLKQSKNASSQKLQAAERALREAALEQLENANKYDLGQCTVEFKKCMQTTAGCGDDFSSCAVMSALDNTSTEKSTSKESKNFQIKGAVTNIEISASTYDMLISKKPLCESITKSCVAVANNVWDTFLREVAPQLKSAEIIAEDKARQDCIGNISSCFQKACKDNMDPNDEDNSYDMCLSRPGAMLNVCKIPLNNCGIDASSEAKAQESIVWDYVIARLAAMRVNACTAEVKECLQSEDRCGEDYTQCIGLDTDSIIRMCPHDALPGCQKVYAGEDIRGDKVYDELANMIQGIMLTIDNNFLTECQKAADEAMIKICGDTESCATLSVDSKMGTRTLEYKICEYTLNEAQNTEEATTSTVTENTYSFKAENCRPSTDGVTEQDLRNNKALAAVLSGLIFWENVGYTEDGLLDDIDSYLAKTEMILNETDRQLIKTELGQLQNDINNKISMLEADPKVEFCMKGREVQGMKITKGENTKPSTRTKIGEKSEETARFPNLTRQMRQLIAEGAINSARDNYYKKYDETVAKIYEDFDTVTKKLSELANEDQLNTARETARKACLQKVNILAARDNYKSDAQNNSTANAQEKQSRTLLESTMIVPFTSGDHKLASTKSTQKINKLQMNSSSYAETSTTKVWNKAEFDWNAGSCKIIVKTQLCTNYGRPGLFRSKRCLEWGAPTEKVTTSNMIITK